jgi:hypothetical protein
VSSNDKDVMEGFTVAPSRCASIEAEEDYAKAHEGPHKEEDHNEAHNAPREEGGSRSKDTAGGGGSSGPGTASPLARVKRKCWMLLTSKLSFLL